MRERERSIAADGDPVRKRQDAEKKEERNPGQDLQNILAFQLITCPAYEPQGAVLRTMSLMRGSPATPVLDVEMICRVTNGFIEQRNLLVAIAIDELPDHLAILVYFHSATGYRF